MKNFYLDADIDNILKNTRNSLDKISGKHILITGGNGFLGSYFVEIFRRYSLSIKNPIRLTVIDNLSIENSNNRKIPNSKNYNFKQLDASKPYKIQSKIDYIIHAAGIASPFYYRKKPLETLDIAINGTRHALELAKSNSAKLLFFSSSEIYGDPDPSEVPINENYRGNVSTTGPRACYDESKRLGETLCYIYNNYFKVNTKIIRPFNIYGPGMNQNDYRILPNFASKLINNEELNIYGTGKQTRTYCYITDAMIGFIKTMINGFNGEVYNIGNPNQEVSVIDLYKIIKKLRKQKVKAKKVNYPSSYPTDEPQRRCPDISKAKKHFKYYPKVDLENGLNFFFEWAEKNYKKNKH